MAGPDWVGAAFVAANKQASGDVRLTRNWESHEDTEWHYTVYLSESDSEQIRVDAYRPNGKRLKTAGLNMTLAELSVLPDD